MSFRAFECIAVGLVMALTGRSLPAVTQQAPPAGKVPEVYEAWPFDAKEALRRQDETAKALAVPKGKTLDLGGGAIMAFLLVPAGKYRMGDAPGSEVSVERPFYFGTTKVTQPQYSRVMGKNPSAHTADSNPVDTVSWADASAFCAKLSEKAKKRVRLPERKEWEWACRAGTATRCYWGDDMTHMGDYCWWHDNCDGKTHPVAKKRPNAFGFYDMMGLLWEWCADGGPGAASHLTCGATFGSREFMFKSTVAISVEDKAGVNDRFGFRVAMDLD